MIIYYFCICIQSIINTYKSINSYHSQIDWNGSKNTSLLMIRSFDYPADKDRVLNAVTRLSRDVIRNDVSYALYWPFSS